MYFDSAQTFLNASESAVVPLPSNVVRLLGQDGDPKDSKSPEQLKDELLGSGDVVLVEGVDGIHGAVLATVLKACGLPNAPSNRLQEANGKCDIKYFDPTEHRIETMSLGLQPSCLGAEVWSSHLQDEEDHQVMAPPERVALRGPGGGDSRGIPSAVLIPMLAPACASSC